MNRLDKIIYSVSPSWFLKREEAKFKVSKIREYEAASKSRRTEGWHTNNSSATVEVGNSIHLLRKRSRQLVRDNPYAKRAIDVIKNHVVGDGITATPKKESKKHVQLWQDWALTPMIDFYGKHNIYGLQELIMRAVAESGEVIVRKRYNKKLPVPFQLQVLESDFIDDENHNNGLWFGSENEHYGMKFDNDGRVLGYWLWETHPGDNNFTARSNYFPANEVIHIYEELRPGQTRGVPMGVSAMNRLKILDGYEDAQLERMQAAACFVAFVTNGSAPSATIAQKSAGALANERMTPGLIQYLEPNEQITFGNPPVSEDGDFKKQNLQAIAIGYGITYEALTGDLSNVNFSSGRMGWMEMARNIKSIQWNTLIPRFLDVVWKEFDLMAQIKYGLQPVGVQWTVPRRVMIDPVKEIKAMIDEVRAGFKSWEEAVRENGLDPDKVKEELRKNQEEFKKLGIIIDSLPCFDADRLAAENQIKNQDTNKNTK